MTESFSSTFREAREKFLAASHAAGARVFTYGRSDITGKDGELLACDVACLGAADADRAVIVIAGTHGAEG